MINAANKIVDKILSNMKGRRGFDDIFHDIDYPTMEEIREEWAEIITDEMKKNYNVGNSFYTEQITTNPLCTVIENKAVGIGTFTMNSMEILNKNFRNRWVVQEIMEIESHSSTDQGFIVILQRLKEVVSEAS